MRRVLVGVAVLAAAVASSVPQSAQAQRVRTGVLNCDVSAGLGLIIGSQRTVNCLFTPDQPGFPQEGYVDTIRGYGFLAGDYAGASGEATVAVGLGANVLVGGSNRTVALQPLSIQGQVGLNVALGVANLSLRPAR